MHFSNILPFLGFTASLIGATPTFGGSAGVGLIGSGTFNSPVSCDLSNSWKDHVLFEGYCSPETETSGGVLLGLNLPICQISGGVGFQCVTNFLEEPKIRLGLGGISAYVEIDIAASAAIHQSVEIFAAPELEIAVPGLKASLGAAVALDLVVGCGAAIDLSAGVYISFPETAYVDISLLTKDVVGLSLEGLVTKLLPIGVGAGVELGAGIEVKLGLRLRSEVRAAADIGLPILNIGAGAGFAAAIWVSLFDYTATIIGAGAGLQVTGSIACNLGLEIDTSIHLGSGLGFHLNPSLSIGLATGIRLDHSQPTRGTCGSFIGNFHHGNGGSIGGPSMSASGLLTASELYTAPAQSSVVVSAPIEPTASAHISHSAIVPGVSLSASFGGSVIVSVPIEPTASVHISHSASFGGSVGASLSVSFGLPDPSVSVSVPALSVPTSVTRRVETPIFTIGKGGNATTLVGTQSGPRGGFSSYGESTAALLTVTESSDHAASTEGPGGQGSPSYTGASTPIGASQTDVDSTVPRSTVTQSPDTGLITSTIRETHVYTITSCAASVMNCPASYTQIIVTSTVVEKVTICPATAIASATYGGSNSPAPTSPIMLQTPVDLSTITQSMATLQPCTEIITSTFTPPTNIHAPEVATVTIVQGRSSSAAEPVTKTPEVLNTLSRVLASVTGTETAALPTKQPAQVASSQASVSTNTGHGARPTGSSSVPTDVPPVTAGAAIIESKYLLLLVPIAFLF